MNTSSIFTEDIKTEKPEMHIKGSLITDAPILKPEENQTAWERGKQFADEIEARYITDFEKPETDKMVHVSTFLECSGILCMTYYANTHTASEDPNHQTARFVFCPAEHPERKTFLDIQSVGDDCAGQRVNLVYDTILAQKDKNTLMILWTAKIGDTYYRLYRPFDLTTQTLGAVGVNRFRVGNVTNDFSTTGIIRALTENGIAYKTMYSDIGIMQKFTTRTEHGERFYYTGAYSGDFNCIIKSRDFITWEYVAAPDFPNLSKWENAVFVQNDICYYFVRQHDETPFGFLCTYHLDRGTWSSPVLVSDCQSRSDFIQYDGQLYLFHAPVDRTHIGVLRIDPYNLQNSKPILCAKMHTSCFYPFVQYLCDGTLAMSYTVDRQHIRMARFDFSKYIRD